MPPETRRDRIGPGIFLLLVCVYLVTFGGHFYSGDGIEVARTAESIVLRGDLALVRSEGEREWGYPGRGGRRFAPYALGQSLAEAPLIAVAAAAAAPLPLDAHLKTRLLHAAAVSSNVFISAAAGWVLLLFARRLGYGRRVAASLALMYGLGTMAWVYAHHDFADPLTALTLLGSACLLRRYGDAGARNDIVLAGILLGLSLFTKYQMVIYAPVIWLYLVFLRKDRGERGLTSLIRDTALLATPVVLFGLGDLAVNYWKFGSLMATGYEQEASPWAGLPHVAVGLYGFLLSPGKSLFLYNPLLVAWPFAVPSFRRSHRSECRMVLAAVAVTLAFFSPLYWWHGDWSWGPRYLLPLIPLMVLTLAPLARAAVDAPRLRRALAALAVAAIVVNLLGLTVNFFFYIRALTGMEFVHDDWNFIPGLSPVAFHAHVIHSDLHEALFGEPIDFVYRAWRDGKFVDAVIPMGEYSRQGKVPDYFFFRPYDTALEQWSLGLTGTFLVAMTVIVALRVRRSLSGRDEAHVR
ncbi:MAG TPA: hypothetical protein VGK94_04820 [Candidatus Polarisedimenticolia bacterium]